jgi:hypothetical protein
MKLLTPRKEAAARRIAGNWRLFKRLPRLAALANALGFVDGEAK